MKCIDDEISVSLNGDREPVKLTWQTREYIVVKVHKKWVVQGKWWLDPDLKGITRRYFLLSLKRGGVDRTMEIHYQSGVWTLSRLAD